MTTVDYFLSGSCTLLREFPVLYHMREIKNTLKMLIANTSSYTMSYLLHPPPCWRPPPRWCPPHALLLLLSVILLLGLLLACHCRTELRLVVKPVSGPRPPPKQKIIGISFLMGAGGPELAVTAQGAQQTREFFLLPRLLLPPRLSPYEGDKKQTTY